MLTIRVVCHARTATMMVLPSCSLAIIVLRISVGYRGKHSGLVNCATLTASAYGMHCHKIIAIIRALNLSIWIRRVC